MPPRPAPFPSGYDFMVANAEVLDAAVVYDRDFSYDFFAYKTLERAYLMKLDGKVRKTPNCL